MPDSNLREYAFALLERGRSHIANSKSGLTKDFVTLSDLTPHRYKVANEALSGYAEFDEIVSHILNHEVLGKRYCKEVVVRLVDDFLIEFLDRSPDTLDEKTFQELYAKFERQLEEDYWIIKSISPLYNLEIQELMSGKAFELSIINDISLVYDPLLCGIMNTDQEILFLSASYKVSKESVSIIDQLCRSVEQAIKKVERLLLALRLFKTGDVGTDVVRCKVYGKPHWEEVVTPLNCKVPASMQEASYVIYPEDTNNGVLQGFCEQVDMILAEPHDERVDIASENFMNAYTKGYVDRVEGLIRGLQALFLKRGDPSCLLSRRASKFAASDEEEEKVVEEIVRKSYDLRSRISHGNISLSSAESIALRNLPLLEQCLRESIFYFIALARSKKLDDIIIQIDDNRKGFDDMKKIRLEANTLFWKGSRNIWKVDEKEVLPFLFGGKYSRC